MLFMHGYQLEIKKNAVMPSMMAILSRGPNFPDAYYKLYKCYLSVYQYSNYKYRVFFFVFCYQFDTERQTLFIKILLFLFCFWNICSCALFEYV